MTPDNDIERVLDQWFAEGPMQMPGRFLDDTLGRIDREPKRRLVGLRPMVVHADPRRLAAAAAVVALLIAGIGSAVVLRTPAVGVNPSPSPSAGAFADPALLVGSWTSDGTRHVPFQNGSHTIDTIVRTDISIGETDLRWANVKTDVLSSKSVVGPDTIEFRMVSSSPPEWKCQVGDAGTYRFRISADGQRLTLTAVSDVCAVRQGVLAGEWLRTEMGDLAPGRHVPGLVEPFGNAGGRMSYTVPAGWNDTWECAECLILTSPLAAMISLDTDIEVSGALASCPPGGRSAAVIAAWLRTLPSLAVSTPTAVSIGGLSGVQVDVSVGDGSSTDACPSSWMARQRHSARTGRARPAGERPWPGHDEMDPARSRRRVDHAHRHRVRGQGRLGRSPRQGHAGRGLVRFHERIGATHTFGGVSRH